MISPDAKMVTLVTRVDDEQPIGVFNSPEEAFETIKQFITFIIHNAPTDLEFDQENMNINGVKYGMKNTIFTMTVIPIGIPIALLPFA